MLDLIGEWYAGYWKFLLVSALVFGFFNIASFFVDTNLFYVISLVYLHFSMSIQVSAVQLPTSLLM